MNIMKFSQFQVSFIFSDVFIKKKENGVFGWKKIGNFSRQSGNNNL